MTKANDEPKTAKRPYNRKKQDAKGVEPNGTRGVIGQGNLPQVATIDLPTIYGIWITNHDTTQNGWATYNGVVFHTQYKAVANAQLHNLQINGSSHRSYEVKEMK